MTSSKLRIAVLVTWIAMICNGQSDVKNCHPHICHPCFSMTVNCKTSDPLNVVPQHLDSEITSLSLVFQLQNSSGQNVTVQLSLDDMQRYKRIQKLRLEGDFTSIGSDALSLLPNLTSFTLKDTKIKSLPDQLLSGSLILHSLSLTNNQLSEIPLKILPPSGRLYLSQLTFSENSRVTLPCVNGTLTLPKSFDRLERLSQLNLARNIFWNPVCSLSISEEFLRPVSGVTSLVIAGSNLGGKIEPSLKVLKRLRSLDISNLSPYTHCPANGKYLFSSIPRTVTSLNIQHWETPDQVSNDCLFTSNILHPLTILKLRRISFAYSDGVFGSTLTKDALPRISTLQRLDLSSCRISKIEIDALAGLDSLGHLTMTGNPLGPKDLELLSNSSSSLRALDLSNTEIRSDDVFQYKLLHIFNSYPNLSTIAFNLNAMTQFPDFSASNASPNTNVFKISAQNNHISHFVSPTGESSSNLCVTFPYLSSLILTANRLTSLNGVERCIRLQKLILDHNRLSYGNNHNTSRLAVTLGHLKKVRILDLSFNSFRVIDKHLLYGMTTLESFHFHNNNLELIDGNQFRYNLQLRDIDLSHNYLQFLDAKLFKGLHKLEHICIQDNKVVTPSSEFLGVVDSLQHLKFFSISDNPYYCGCDKTVQNWLRNNSLQRSSLVYITCGGPEDLKDHLVYDYDEDVFECHIKNIIIIAGSICGGFLITLGIALPCYKYRWYISNAKVVWKALVGSLELAKLEHVCPYDAYLSFDPNCPEDAKWVVEELIPAIEECQDFNRNTSSSISTNLKRYRLYVECRDSLSGTSRFTEREIALQKSKRILIIVSNSYLRSTDCLSEADLAGLHMHGTEFYQPNRVMLLIREELSEEIIRPPMSSLLRGKTLKVTSAENKKSMWRKLRQFLSEPLYYYAKSEKINVAKSISAGEGDNSDSADTTPLLAESM